MPIPSPEILACTFGLEGAVPDEGDSVSHGVLALTVPDQLTVPAPRLEILSGTGAGSPCPRKALKLTVVGLTPSVGLLTINVTGMLCGLLAAPEAEIVMAPV